MPLKVTTRMLVAVLAAGAAPVFSAGETAGKTADDFAGMFTAGTPSIDLRYRYEYVDDDAFDKEANASTLRTRLTFSSAAFKGFGFLGEFDDVSHIVENDYNSTENGKTEYPVVADPTGTDLNQAWLKYTAAGASGTYGRQRIVIGRERFVGGVNWRQNEQTYEGFRAYYEGKMGLKVDLAYVDKVNRIFGPDNGPAQPADLNGDNYFATVDWQFLPNHTLSGFAYLLDIDNDPDYPVGVSAGNASDTYGAEYAGSFGPVKLNAAYATQSDAADNPQDYDADYYFAEGALTLAPITASLGYEVLASGDGVGFSTPYATLHKFQGWADKFLVTPAEGIEDLYAGLAGALGPVKLAAIYHDFTAEGSGGDYGSELDLSATWPVTKEFSVQLKYANFDSDSDAYTDAYKTWMTLQFRI